MKTKKLIAEMMTERMYQDRVSAMIQKALIDAGHNPIALSVSMNDGECYTSKAIRNLTAERDELKAKLGRIIDIAAEYQRKEMRRGLSAFDAPKFPDDDLVFRYNNDARFRAFIERIVNKELHRRRI